jgi:high-affinity Fe2+/Pb2+ permease
LVAVVGAAVATVAAVVVVRVDIAVQCLENLQAEALLLNLCLR